MIKEFKLNIPQSEIDDLKERIHKTRWFENNNSNWELGTNTNYLKELLEYWKNNFDWRNIESQINSFPNYITHIDNLKVHFLHIKSNQPNATPLLITHGWPGSFMEMLKIIPLLKTQFDLVIPSIIGFGFSENNLKKSINYDFVAEIWHQLMLKLGYQNYGLQGGDLGAGISIRLAQKYSKHIIGMHLNYISDSYKPYLINENDKEFRAYQEHVNNWNKKEGAYAIIQSTKPLSLAYGLNDSPVGLCAWIIEKFNAWSDHDNNIENSFSKDELLANVSLYWFTKTIYSSMQIYNGISLSPLVFKKNDYVNIPVGFAKFPKEIPIPPRGYIEKGLNIVHWTEMSKGGHFAALEQPNLLASDIKSFFKKIAFI